MIIKCIALDDEPLALEKMSNYIKKTPFLELKLSIVCLELKLIFCLLT
jgi:hypothetical protein